MVLYADVLFAINFSMDFLSLYICARIMHQRICKGRMLSASAIGALYGVYELIFTMPTALKIFVCILVSLIMCLISYKQIKIQHFTLIYIMFWGVSTALGGLMSLLYSFINRLLSDYISKYSYESVYTGARFFVVLFFTVIISVIFARIFTSQKDIRSAELVVNAFEKTYKMQALCDSGNILREPFSGKCVILVSADTELGRAIEKTQDIYKRYIPFKGVNDEGILKGIIPKTIILNEKMVDAIVAPTNNKDFGGYEALAPITVL